MRALVLLALALVLALVVWLVLRDGGAQEGAALERESFPAALDGEARAQPARLEPGARRSVPAAIEAGPALPDPQATPGGLEVLVRHAGGELAEGIEVRALGGGELLGGGRTDERGRALLDVPEIRLEIFALTPVGQPAKATVGAGERHAALRLDDRAEVSGRVLVDGEVPSAPLEIALLSSKQPSLPFALPAAAREAFLHAQAIHPGRTGADGSFHFRVPADFRGQVSFADHRWWIEGERFLEQGPRTGILLRLTSWPILRGRLLAADGLTPVAGGGVSLIVPPEAPAAGDARVSRERRFGTETSADGTFELPFVTRHAVVAELGLRGPGGEGRAERAIALRPAADADAGDVALEGGESLVFTASTPGGAPLAGVVARTAALAPSAPTDEAGRGRVHIRPGENGRARVTFHAQGHATRTIELGSPLPARLEVVLEPTTRLELDLAPEDLARGSTLLLVLSSAEPVFEERGFRAALELSWSPAYFEVIGLHSVVPPPERTEVHMALAGRDVQTNGNPRALDGLPRAPLDLRVQDLSGATLWSADHIVLQPGEPRRLEVRIAPPRPLSIRVLAPDGEPAPEPTVYVMVPGGARELRRGPEGDLEVIEVQSASVSVFAFSAGLAPSLMRDVPVPPEGLVLNVELRAGRTVEVEVLNPGGERVGGVELVVLAEIPGLPLRAEARGRLPLGPGEALEPGLFLLEGMPDGPFEVVLFAGGRSFVREIRDTSARAAVALPAPGALEIAWTALTRSEAELDLLLYPHEGSAENPFAVEGALAGPLALTARADAAGLLEPLVWPGVYPGRYELRVRDDRGAALQPRALEVRPGATLELQLPPPAPW